jgi:hypothetical protein
MCFVGEAVTIAAAYGQSHICAEHRVRQQHTLETRHLYKSRTMTEYHGSDELIHRAVNACACSVVHVNRSLERLEFVTP